MFKKFLLPAAAALVGFTGGSFTSTAAHAATFSGGISVTINGACTSGDSTLLSQRIVIGSGEFTTTDQVVTFPDGSTLAQDDFVIYIVDSAGIIIGREGNGLQPSTAFPANSFFLRVQSPLTAAGNATAYMVDETDRFPDQSLGATFVNPGAAVKGSNAFDLASLDADCAFVPADSTDPVVTVPANISVNTDVGVSTAVVAFSPIATDNVGVTSLIASPASGSTFVLGTTTVTVTAMDAAGNSDTDTFTVTVSDNENPVVTVPANITVNNDPGSSGAVVTFPTSPAAADNVGVSSFVASPASGATYPIGTTTVTATAQDAAGNTGSNSFTVTVTDVEAPSLNVPTDVNVNVDPGTAGAVVNFSPTATDNSGVAPTIISNPASGATFPVGTTVVNVTARDAAGNTTAGMFSVTVDDDEAPVFNWPIAAILNTTPGLATAVLDAAGFPDPIDVVSGTISPTITSSPTTGLRPGDAFPLGQTTLMATAVDAAGNVASRPVTIFVLDNERPVLNVPADITVSTDAGSATAIVNFTPTATDNDGVASLVSRPASGSAFPVGETTVNVTAKDNSGNTSFSSFKVTVEDNEVPVVTVPADIGTVTDPGQATAVVSFTVTATDAVDGALTPTITTSPTAGLNSGSAFPIGTTTVSAAATDAAGNTTTETFDVTVTDNQAPVFTSMQADINVEIDFNLTSAVINFPTPTATDNSGVVSVTRTQGLPSGSAFPVGTTLVEFTATDGSGLTTVLQFNVTVGLIPPGTVSFVVNSVDDGTITFSSATAAFNTAVVVTGGTGSSGNLQVVPGSYTVNYALPAGFAVTAASCSSANGTVNTTTQTLSLTFARGETYVCTLTSLDLAERTGQQIQHFMDNRGRQIMANRPDQDRRIARVNGDNNLNTVSMFNNQLNNGVSPFGFGIDQESVFLSFASTSASADLMTARSDWDVWFEASFSLYETGFGEGQFGIFHGGVDYRIDESTILGFGIQIDSTSEDVIGTNATTEGVGWMVGPYYTTRIGEGLYLDASLSYGRADNEISPLGTYTDRFDSERWLATLSLFGGIDRGNLNIRPKITIAYFEETSEAYVDSLAVPIAARTTRLGDLELGSRFTWTDALGQFSNYIEFESIYAFEASGEVATQSTVDTGVRARVGVGGMAIIGKGASVEYGLQYDGLGDSNYEAISISFGVSAHF